METKEVEKPRVKDLNEHIACPLCRGYLIDATTLAECLHSFCRGCIVRRLSSGARICPVCNVPTTPPLLPDTKLQRIVYLLVPALYRSELERRRHFRVVNPQCSPLPPPLGSLDLTLDDLVSLSLREITDEQLVTVSRRPRRIRRCRIGQRTGEGKIEFDEGKKIGSDDQKINRFLQSEDNIRYLKCPAGVTVRHLVRLLMLKRGWKDANASKIDNNDTSNSGVNVAGRIEMFCEKYHQEKPEEEDETAEEEEDQEEAEDDFEANRGNMTKLDLSWTLFDLACIFNWNRESPMNLYYLVLRKEESTSTTKTFAITNQTEKKTNPHGALIENTQRPPTPPPSPKLNQIQIQVPQQQEQQQQRVSDKKESFIPRPMDPPERDKEPKMKKPRCEVTPVLRSPEPLAISNVSSHNNRGHSITSTIATPVNAMNPPPVISPIPDSNTLAPLSPSGNKKPPSKSSSKRNKELSKLEHRKRRKRRNKRVIAEITTTPREDLLKLKVRLTPCPPRITSTSSTGQQTKDKLLQMRAVRREKIKSDKRNNSHSRDEIELIDTDETIEEIIDAIPDEVVRVAQSISLITSDSMPKLDRTPPQQLTDVSKPCQESITRNETLSYDLPKKDEEILRRLGLVAIAEANDNRDKSKVNNKAKSEDRQLLEKQLRESKANRVRSLLAEKQMRDALKSIMSKTKEDGISVTTPVLKNFKTQITTVTNKKKGPPPLAPLRVNKQSSPGYPNGNPKYEKPLDLSNGGGSNSASDNVLDLTGRKLSTALVTSSLSSSSPSSCSFASSSSSSSPTCSASLSSASSTSTSTSSSLSFTPTSSTSPSCLVSSSSILNLPKATTTTITSSGNPNNNLVFNQLSDNISHKSKDMDLALRGIRPAGQQDTNLRTLSDAAVSLLSGINDKIVTTQTAAINPNVNKVALRIPQPQQRITSYGVKIKPNLGIRHIPNPQAVVASQYRNQRASFFNSNNTLSAQQPQ